MPKFTLPSLIILCTAVVAGAVVAGCSGNSPTAPSAGSGAGGTGAVISGTVAGQGEAAAASAGFAAQGPAGAFDAVLSGTSPGAITGLIVEVVGTDISVVVGPDGTFQIFGVPEGDVQLRFRSATVNVILSLNNVASDQFIELEVQVTDTTVVIVNEQRLDKVTLCHAEGNGTWHLIDISENAEADHRSHGDAGVGEPVPGMPPMIFDENCQPIGPSVDIEKSTNGEDADAPPGPSITLGSEVTWTYHVVNNGTVELTDIVVTDDQGVVVDCGGQTTLAPGDSMTCTSTGTTLVTELGPYGNVGDVTAHWSTATDSGTVSDSDASHYVGISPVDIEKLTNGEDADTPRGPSIVPGDNVIWEYVVTNLGTVDLTEIAVVDDQGVVVDCGGQTTLAPGASMTCTGAGIAIEGQYGNVGEVTATWTAVTDTGPVSGPATDSDPSHYFGTDEEDGPKVTLCHRTGAGFYVEINVSVNAEPAHRAHGDGAIGEAVPDHPGQVFGAGCSVQ